MKILMSRLALSYNPAGGMERTGANLANGLQEKGIDVLFAYFDPKHKGIYYPMNSRVQVVNLADEIEPRKKAFDVTQRAIREVLRVFSREKSKDWKYHCLLLYFKEILKNFLTKEQPDVLISFDIQTTYLWKNSIPADLDIPIVTMFHFPVNKIIDWNWSLAVQILKDSRIIQVLMPSDKELITQRLPDSNVVVIPNAISIPQKAAPLTKHKPPYHIIHVGRFSRNGKRQHLLLKAFKLISDDFPDWDLSFWGDGDKTYQKELMNIVADSPLKNKVSFRGITRNIEKEYINSDLFVFPSKFEGFGMAMMEAMAAGLPVIAFRSCDAARHLISDGETGLLAEDGIHELAKAMSRCMKNKNLRLILARNARISVANYSPEKIWQKWDDLLKGIINRDSSK